MFAKPFRSISILLFTAAFAAAMFGIIIGIEIYREYSIAGGLIGTLIPAIVVTAIVPAALVPLGRWMWQLEFPQDISVTPSDSEILNTHTVSSSRPSSERHQTNRASELRLVSWLRWVAAMYFFLAAISAGLYDVVYIYDIISSHNKSISLVNCTICVVILAFLMAIYAKSGIDLIKTASGSRSPRISIRHED